MIDPSGVADVFRTEWPRLVATLVRDVGDLDLAEDVAQEAFIEAASRWGRDGRPDRPGAWLLTTARRKAIDRVRRSKRFEDRIPALAETIAQRPDHDLVDDQLALLCGCCHPALSPDAQVALTLRSVGGLSTEQIARAFFVSEATMTRRLTRAKTKIREANIPLVDVDIDVLESRLPVVRAVIYSIFTEGHTATGATTLVRGDLCDEAVWLAGLLRQLVPNDSETASLHALVLLIDARRATRVDAEGVPVMLADQDRSLWDQHKIRLGLDALESAGSLDAPGAYRFQAMIAALHATAPTFAETDWPAIVRLYDVQLATTPSPVLALNRAIAVAGSDGPRQGLAALDVIVDLDDYVYFHSARAELLSQIGSIDESRAAFDRALELCRNDAERRHLERRRSTLDR